MMQKPILYSLLFVIVLPFQAIAVDADSIPKLQNPMTVEYLQENLEKRLPRLVLNRDIQKDLRKKLKTDPVLKNMYQALLLNAAEIRQEPLLERIKTGRRLLSVSRELLYRINILGMIYALDGDKEILDRINDEVVAVCHFSDWNPSHYLDVAEMAMGVAFAIDWTAGKLPDSTVALAKAALIEKGIKPSYNPDGNTGWVDGTNNWNQVCHGGMIAAAIAVADEEPELAAETIHRALEGMPHALVEYGPDGVYPEGSTYWSYGTSFTVFTAAMFESAFGTDFGIADYPSLKESAVFRKLSVAPSGWYYNFADCGDKRSANGDLTLAWFAAKTGNPLFFEKERFLRPPAEMGKLSRNAGAAMVWLSQFEPSDEEPLPTAWQGGGANPVVFFQGGPDDPHQYYFGGKGGRGMVNHGNMDGGSFIFELDGVRWVIDPGNQAYHELEKTGFNLWGRCQSCERWTLLTKNNYGHSTLTINDSLHHTEGLATIHGFKKGPNPEATVDMTATLGKSLIGEAERRFVKDGPRSLLIEDHITTHDSTKLVTWQLITQAEVEWTEGGAILRQDGKELRLENLSHPDLMFSLISLDPPPLQLDRRYEGLKRIELRLPAYLFEGGDGEIRMRLVGAN